VIFDAEQHAAVRSGYACGLPDLDRVQHVAKMEESGRSRGEAGNDRDAAILT
jgi:hypothetical protein